MSSRFCRLQQSAPFPMSGTSGPVNRSRGPVCAIFRVGSATTVNAGTVLRDHEVLEHVR